MNDCIKHVWVLAHSKWAEGKIDGYLLSLERPPRELATILERWIAPPSILAGEIWVILPFDSLPMENPEVGSSIEDGMTLSGHAFVAYIQALAVSQNEPLVFSQVMKAEDRFLGIWPSFEHFSASEVEAHALFYWIRASMPRMMRRHVTFDLKGYSQELRTVHTAIERAGNTYVFDMNAV
ncbi:hypothetical protein [Crossiella sp. NPDC003009]